MNINENKLNRSRSESDLYNGSFDSSFQRPSSFYNSPTAIRTVVIEEIYGSDIRRYTSCTQLYGDNSSKIGHIQNSFNNITADISENNFEMKSRTASNKHSLESSNYLGNSKDVVPMDVDTSFDWDERYPKRMGTDHESSFNRSKTTDARYKALENVLKQRVAIPKSCIDAATKPCGIAVRSLEQRKHWADKIKVLGFIGSQGVGKTFVANIMKKHFVPKLVHDIIGVHLQYETQQKKVLDAINNCCLNLVIIDDLTRKDEVELFAFVQSLPKNHFILVVSIFSIQYLNNDLESEIRYDDIIQIRDAFDHSGLYHELFVFREFTREKVEKWIKKQLVTRNVSSQMMEVIMKSVLDGHDIKKEGLKGLQAKMLLELERQKK
ncbi:hypothetical protein JTB14_029971 [Gonioctena quinquepunctata]|nr:hypothetical protein JTB14_029971 [Gonioctena quinquepunctata]